MQDAMLFTYTAIAIVTLAFYLYTFTPPGKRFIGKKD
ncbi:hypothetical protein Barb6_01335 [Bacteroidales bacterium Barb6]|nr:hypothetical protein Barb6XT_00659 [Bacteroidales bacterium Barb6XT]OAV71824.1 hypothetical protein Barb6_01335 [Bacteroidales bacterium Barb6]